MSTEYYVADTSTGKNFMQFGEVVAEGPKGITLKMKTGTRTFRRNQLRHAATDQWVETPKHLQITGDVLNIKAPPAWVQPRSKQKRTNKKEVDMTD